MQVFGNWGLSESPCSTALKSLAGPNQTPRGVKMGFFEGYLLDVMMEPMKIKLIHVLLQIILFSMWETYFYKHKNNLSQKYTIIKPQKLIYVKNMAIISNSNGEYHADIF